MPDFHFHTLDVFTTDKYGGNPLAVVLDADALTTEAMQVIAREFNLSETIFVRTPADPAHTASVRIFFPTAEIPFAGHPTVGCAILLAQMQHPGEADFETEITLEEVAGLVPVTVTRKNGLTKAQFQAPVVPHPVEPQRIALELIANAVNLPTDAIGFHRHQPAVHAGGPSFLFVPVINQSALERVKPIEPYWSEMCGYAGTGGVYVYRQDGEDGFRARMLAPTDGIPEDPATGSASAILASQLMQAGVLADGTSHIGLRQGLEMGRPSDLWLEIDVVDQAIAAVRVSGYGVRMSHGVLHA